jgi:hypothetical protein
MSDPRTFQSFDAGSDGSHLAIVTSLYESSSGVFEASALSVSESGEVVSTGPASFQYQGFQTEAGLVRLIENQKGSSLLAVMGDESLLTELHLANLQSGNWSAVTEVTGLSGTPVPPASPSSLHFLRSPFSGVFDAVGRVHLLWGGQPLWLEVWDGASFVASERHNINAESALGTDTRDSRFLTSLDDWTCVFHRNSVASGATGLYSTCFAGVKDDINTDLRLDGIAEFDAASDGAGNFLVLARPTGENAPLSFWMGVNEEGDLIADTEAISLLRELPEGTYGFPSGSIDESPAGALLPGFKLAALGESKFLAVWVAIQGTSTLGKARLYSAIYDVALRRWSEPEWIDSFESPYTNHISLSALQLKGNERGDAVLAVSHVLLEGASVAEDIRVTQVSRFHVDEGWLPLQSLGDGCGRIVLAGVNPTRECTHNPAVALTRTGDALAVFPDQDEDGIFRVKASVFSR